MHEGFNSLIMFCLVFHMYWAQIFVLSKKILRDIKQICRNFLWHGVYFSAQPGNIAAILFVSPSQLDGLELGKFRCGTKLQL